MPSKAETATSREVGLTRIFDAPRALVWTAWTDAEQLAKWWGPKCFTNPVCDWAARPGGRILIHMTAPDGTVYPMTGTFREAVPPEHLVFMAVAEDIDGNLLLESLTTVAFEELVSKTRLTVEASAIGIAPIAPQMLAGMEQGWSESLDKLADVVARAGNTGTVWA